MMMMNDDNDTTTYRNLSIRHNHGACDNHYLLQPQQLSPAVAVVGS